MTTLSILTICRNDKSNLASTIRSVEAQYQGPDEFIVLDGASTDGTVEFLEKCKAVTAWKSEPDAGIADAFNKIAKLATSEWVLFLNAGDILAGADLVGAVKDYLSTMSEDVGVCYGDALVVDPSERQQTKIQRGNHFLTTHDTPICHQAAFIRRKQQIENPYDIRLRIGMDYDLWHRLTTKCKFQRIDSMICHYRLGGMSSSKSWGEHSIIAHHMVDWLNTSHRKLGIQDVWQLFNSVIVYRLKKRIEGIVGERVYIKMKHAIASRRFTARAI